MKSRSTSDNRLNIALLVGTALLEAALQKVDAPLWTMVLTGLAFLTVPSVWRWAGSNRKRRIVAAGAWSAVGLAAMMTLPPAQERSITASTSVAPKSRGPETGSQSDSPEPIVKPETQKISEPSLTRTAAPTKSLLSLQPTETVVAALSIANYATPDFVPDLNNEKPRWAMRWGLKPFNDFGLASLHGGGDRHLQDANNVRIAYYDSYLISPAFLEVDQAPPGAKAVGRIIDGPRPA